MTPRPYNFAAWERELQAHGLDDLGLPPLPDEGYLRRCEDTLREWEAGKREPIHHGCDSGADLACRVAGEPNDRPEEGQIHLVTLVVGILITAILAAISWMLAAVLVVGWLAWQVRRWLG